MTTTMMVLVTDTRRSTREPAIRSGHPSASPFMGAGGAGYLILLWVVLAGCQVLSGPPTILGEIDDTEIRLAQNSAPAAARLELTNVGKSACALVPMLSAQPVDALPLVDGRVAMTLGGDDDNPTPMEAYVELNGEPVEREGGLFTEQGWVTNVNPGDVVMLDIGLQGIPDKAERIVVCNGQGDYDAGRYAVLAFDR